MSPFIRLVRPVNLLFIIMIQGLFRWCMVMRPLDLAGFNPHLPWWGFITLVLSTVCIAAAGYVVNDLYDTDIDRINRPSKVIIGEEVTEGQATRYFWTLNVIGFLLGLAAAISVGKWRLVTIQAVMAALMLFYAQSLKRKLIIGNITVALSAALVIGILPLYELQFAPQMEYRTGLITAYVLMAAAGYAGFAFLTTLVREIVKDIQDMPGDREEGCQSIPIVFGEKMAKIIALVITVIVEVAVVVISFKVIGIAYVPGMAGMGVVVLLGLVSGYKIFRAKDQNGYRSASTWIKVWMLAGVLSMLIFRFSLQA